MAEVPKAVPPFRRKKYGSVIRGMVATEPLPPWWMWRRASLLRPPLHSLHQESGGTNEINFMCNFSKNMILPFQFSGNQSNPACDAMLKLSFQVEPIVTHIKNYWNTRLKRQKRAGLAISPPEVRKPQQSFSSLLASVQLPSRSKNTGLTRSGKSCRSRRADLNKEAFSVDEERLFPCRWLLETDHFPYLVQLKTLWILEFFQSNPLETTATGADEN